MTGDLILDAPRISPSALISWSQRLEGTFYRFRLAWNARTWRWSLDITAADGTLLAAGLPIRSSINAMGGLNDRRLPPGQIFALPVSDNADPGRDAFTTTHRLVYRTAALVEAAAGTEDEVR